MITLKQITILDKNMPECNALSVTKEQDNFVAPNIISLAQAYDTEKAFAAGDDEKRAKAYAIYEDDTMAGFIMYGYFPPEPDETEETAYSTTEYVYYVWRLLIDVKYQRKGIGKEAVRQVMEEIKTKPFGDARYCYVSYEPSNMGSQTTFKNYGFQEDGRVLDGEQVAGYLI
jgi:diamine N-acetyltransferase